MSASYKKNRLSRIIGLFIAVILMLNFTASFAFAEEGEISVYIDGVKVEYDAKPEIVNGRTMVPFRKTFELLGFTNIRWDSFEHRANATLSTQGGISILVGSDVIAFFTKGYKTDVKAYIKEGRVYIPLRVVSEMLSADVDWDNDTRTVTITSAYPQSDYILDDAFEEKHIRTSYYEDEYFDLSIDGNMLTFSGKVNYDDIKSIGLRFNNSLVEGSSQVQKDGSFESSINLKKYNISGEETIISVYADYRNDNSRLYYDHMLGTVLITKDGGSYKFVKPEFFQANVEFMSNWESPIGYTEIYSDYKAEKELSDKICEGASSNMEKAERIYNWVTENIYYDRDMLRQMDEYIDNEEYGKLNNLTDQQYRMLDDYKGVCEGYARITQTLMRAQNIPCRIVIGEYWYYNENNELVYDDLLHAWNQAYIDNRWVHIDTTFGSENIYENGKYIKKDSMINASFDPSAAVYSSMYKITEIVR